MNMNGTDIALKIENVTKAFGSLKILKGVNLEAKKAETIVILGRSGTGKSVILKCIIGLLTPDSGKIIAFGMDSHNLTKEQRPIFRKKSVTCFRVVLCTIQCQSEKISNSL